jgi:hypothetical protein
MGKFSSGSASSLPAHTFAFRLCPILLLGLLEAMCLSVSAQSTKKLEVISPGAAVMLLWSYCTETWLSMVSASP